MAESLKSQNSGVELKNQLHAAIFIKIKRFGITKFFIYFDTEYLRF